MRRLRVILSLLILCSAFLPLSRCSSDDNSQTRIQTSPASLRQTLFPTNQPSITYFYGFDFFQFRSHDLEKGSALPAALTGLVFLLAFLWPVLLCVVGDRLFSRRYKILYSGQMLLCLGSLYVIWYIANLGTWLYGAYVATGCVVALGASSLAVLFQKAGRDTA